VNCQSEMLNTFTGQRTGFKLNREREKILICKRIFVTFLFASRNNTGNKIIDVWETERLT